MKSWIHVLLAFATGIVVYDALASFISLSTGIDYVWFGLGSLAIHFLTGLFVARLKNILLGVASAAVVGVVEATVGWAVSYLIGPGKPAEATTIPIVIFIIFFASIAAGLIGLLGALTGVYVIRPK